MSILGKLIPSLDSDNERTETVSKRRYARRAGDHCVCVIDGKIYPVDNWSLGGFLIAADDRQFGINQNIDVTMKFKLRDTILDVPHKASVVRKSQGRVGLEFLPMSKKVKTSFQQVVDDFVSQSFVDSQT